MLRVLFFASVTSLVANAFHEADEGSGPKTGMMVAVAGPSVSFVKPKVVSFEVFVDLTVDADDSPVVGTDASMLAPVDGAVVSPLAPVAGAAETFVHHNDKAIKTAPVRTVTVVVENFIVFIFLSFFLFYKCPHNGMFSTQKTLVRATERTIFKFITSLFLAHYCFFVKYTV
jgi:hypothetical protein